MNLTSKVHSNRFTLIFLMNTQLVDIVYNNSYDSIRGLTYIWWTKWCKLKVRDFIHETTFSRVKFCVETESDIKNAQLPT